MKINHIPVFFNLIASLLHLSASFSPLKKAKTSKKVRKWKD
jgi:hypothetical protein